MFTIIIFLRCNERGKKYKKKEKVQKKKIKKKRQNIKNKKKKGACNNLFVNSPSFFKDKVPCCKGFKKKEKLLFETKSAEKSYEKTKEARLVNLH